MAKNEPVPLLLPIPSRNLKQKNEALEITLFIRWGKHFNLDYVQKTIDFCLSLVLASGKFLKDLECGIGNNFFSYSFSF